MPQQTVSTLSKARALVKRREKQGDYSASIGVEERDYGPGSRRRKVYTVRYQGNPARRIGSKLTKAQRKLHSAKTSKKRRVAKALQGFLKQLNPSQKCAGAQLRKNKGGSITIIPVKLPRAKR